MTAEHPCACPQLRSALLKPCPNRVDAPGAICPNCISHQEPSPDLIAQHARKRRMEERAERMYEMLGELEWAGENADCPSCGGVVDCHRDSCKLASLLKEIEGE